MYSGPRARERTKPQGPQWLERTPECDDRGEEVSGSRVTGRLCAINRSHGAGRDTVRSALNEPSQPPISVTIRGKRIEILTLRSKRPLGR